METYATYRYYDEKGRRLSIFAIPELGKKYTFTCRKDDVFSKKAARNFLQYILTEDSLGIATFQLNPKIEEIPTDYTKNQFIADCSKKHRKMYEVEIEGEFISQSKAKQLFKTSRQKFVTVKILA